MALPSKKKGVALSSIIVLLILTGMLFFSQKDIFGENIDLDDWDSSFWRQEMDFSSWKWNLFDNWYTYSTFNFSINYYNEAAVSELIENVEKVYAGLIKDLGYIYYFYPKKLKIYIYRDGKEYHKKTGMNEWAGGHSDLKKFAIYAYERDDLTERIIVHELTHLVFEAYMEFPKIMNTSWIHEGLAQYQEKKFKKSKWNIKELKEKVRANTHIPLSKAIKMHMGLESDARKVNMWYLQMGTAIHFMLSLGDKGFRIFSENLKRYRNISEALCSTYPWEFKNIMDLEKKWEKWILKQPDEI